MTGTEVEKALDAIRRQLANAQTPQDILAAGEPIAELIEAIENDLARLTREIAAEAENVDRGRTSQLRAEWNRASDLMTDTENLSRRIDERHAAALKAESEAEMQALARALAGKGDEIRELFLSLEQPMRAMRDGAVRLFQLTKELEQGREQLNAAGRSDLKPAHVWAGHPGLMNSKSPSRVLDFLWAGDRIWSEPVPRLHGAEFLMVVDWLKNREPAGGASASPASGLVAGVRARVKRAS